VEVIFLAFNTSKDLGKIVIYEVFTRAYGGFNAVKKDLERIKALGVDVIWFMPIHPVGIKNRKGTLGSPYAIMDYRSLDPALGSVEDFKTLIRSIHEMKMKAMMDTVFNHMSSDSVLTISHPEWFMRDKNGNPTRKVPDWSDIVDFDFSNFDLGSYLIDTLKFWISEFDIDGFRCDVAGLVPITFWNRARAELSNTKDLIWLSESKDPYLYQAFDITYDYDSYDILKEYFNGKVPLSNYTSNFEYQKKIFDDYAKLRFLENHDQDRIAHIVPKEKLRAWTAMLVAQKGALLLYNGQEYALEEKPDIFNEYHFDFSKGDKDFHEFVKTLLTLRKDMDVMRDGKMDVLKNDLPESTISILRTLDGKLFLYIGNFEKSSRKITLDFDGKFSNTYIHAYEHIKQTPYTFYINKDGKAIFDVDDYLFLSAYRG